MFIHRDRLLPQCLTNGLSSRNETYREYSLAPADDMIRLSGSDVKVTAFHRGDEGMHVNPGTSNSSPSLILQTYIQHLLCTMSPVDKLESLTRGCPDHFNDIFPHMTANFLP